MKNKEFLSIDQQIDLLQSRGLLIADREAAQQALESINYYRLSGYTLTLRKNDTFYSGITFENVLDIYNFDSCLRRLILDFSETIEVSMRTHIAYHHAEAHGKLGYLLPEYYSNPKFAEGFLKDLYTEIERSKEVFVKHYRDNYDCVFPIWVVIELIGFGDLSRLYANLLPDEKSLIANKYYGVHEAYLENWVRCTSELRNICAHRGRIFNRPLPSGVNLFSEYSGIDKKRFFSHFIAILKLLNTEKRQNCIQAFKTIKLKYPYPLMKHLGAPENWEEILNGVC